MKRLLLFALLLSLGSCILEDIDFKKPLPQAIEATEVTSKSFVANWKKVVGVEKYLLDVADDPSFSEGSYVFGYKSIEVEGGYLLVDDLIPNKEYYYRVRSQNKSGVSDYSNLINLSTGEMSAPVLQVLNITETSFQVSWEAVDAAEKYALEIALDAKFQTFLTDYQSKVIEGRVQEEITGIEAGQIYYIRMKSIKGTLSSAYSEVTEVVASSLEIPVSLPPSKVRAIYFQADWEEVPGADSYILEVATDADFQSLLEGYESIETTELTYRVQGLDVFTNYYYRVRAKNVLTVTEPSAPMYVQSGMPTACQIQVYDYSTMLGHVQLTYNANKQLTEFIYTNTNNFNKSYKGEIVKYRDAGENGEGHIRQINMRIGNATTGVWNTSVDNYWVFVYDEQDRVDYVVIYGRDNPEEDLYRERQLQLEYQDGKVIRLNKFVDDGSKGNLVIEQVHNYEYDELGNVIKMSNKSGIETMEYDDEVNPFVVHHDNLALILNFNGEEDYRAFITPNNIIKQGNGFFINTVEYQYNNKGFPTGGERQHINSELTNRIIQPMSFTYQGCF